MKHAFAERTEGLIHIDIKRIENTDFFDFIYRDGGEWKSTPKGNYCFKSLLYRRDRVPNIKTDLKKIIIKKNMGWCDDPQSKSYNKLIIIPNKFRFERLYKKENMYDIILVIDYNLNPTIKNKGSAIFLHIAKRNYSPTAGCIAVSKKDMHLILTCINKKTKIKIY